MSVVAVADSTQLSDETERSDALSDQLDEEAQPAAGCGHGKLPSGFDVQAILVEYTWGDLFYDTTRSRFISWLDRKVDKYCY